MRILDPAEFSRVTITIEMTPSGVTHTYTFPVVEKVSMDWKPVLDESLTLGVYGRTIVVPASERGIFRIEGEALADVPADLFTYRRGGPIGPEEPT